MPRYYFDIREGLRFRPDRVGEEFEDLGSAKGHAVHLAGEIAKDMPLDPSNHVVIVEVCNEHKERVVTVTVASGSNGPRSRNSLCIRGVRKSQNPPYGTHRPLSPEPWATSW